ncbi:hypothetical protein [Lacipirellula sp.]|uniref:hypothetical protein n=1 Tax=Lacipirellula sp. TaxID=2691419 RepID=UPI003D0CCE4C
MSRQHDGMELGSRAIFGYDNDEQVGIDVLLEKDWSGVELVRLRPVQSRASCNLISERRHTTEGLPLP